MFLDIPSFTFKITLERHSKNQANVVLAPDTEYSVFSG